MLLLGIYPRTAERELKHLVDLGLLIMEGVGRSTVYRIAAQLVWREKIANKAP
jgi:hypothetical protein